MYDSAETDISYEYLLKLKDKAKSLRWAVIGGWGVFLQAKKEYQKAFGKEYIKSRDIDVFIDAKYEDAFLKIIKDLGFKESSYKFRYELVYDRDDKKIISSEKAKERHIFNLIYIFLDVFSNKKAKKLGSWVFPDLDKAEIENIEGFPVLGIKPLIDLKIVSFFGREKLDKELKDACDIYALLIYSGKKAALSLNAKKAIDKIISRPDLQDYIAEQVLGDSLKSSLVGVVLRRLILSKTTQH
ncbi:MAG: hypothetical protein AABX63_05200 [Nanoarchaeota archaeon]